MLSTHEFIRNVTLWTPTHGHTGINLLAKTYIHELCVDCKCHLEDLPKAMADRWMVRVCQGNLMMIYPLPAL